MKTLVLASLAALALPMASQAQDDLYFVPSKKNVPRSVADYGMPRDTYYSGSRRSVDDYNRHRPHVRSHVETIDSAGNRVTTYGASDVIDFDGAMGVYPDSAAIDTAFSVMPQDDYECTRRMSRFDDYAWRDGYRDGYYAGRSQSWRWNDPWYWDYPYYYGYYGWGSPYYYSSWYWNDPWYWGGWYGHHHHWYGPTYVVNGGGWRGGARRGSFSGSRTTTGHGSSRGGNFGTRRSSVGTSRSGSFGGTRSNGSFSGQRTSTYSNSNNTFSGSRNTGSFSSGGSRGGSFGGGGSRGGGFSGGSRGGGGGRR